MFVVFIRMYDLTYNVQTEMARQNATMLSEMLKEFRTIYTSEVVSRVKPQGIEVTHDYKTKKGDVHGVLEVMVPVDVAQVAISENL